MRGMHISSPASGPPPVDLREDPADLSDVSDMDSDVGGNDADYEHVDERGRTVGRSASSSSGEQGRGSGALGTYASRSGGKQVFEAFDITEDGGVDAERYAAAVRAGTGAGGSSSSSSSSSSANINRSGRGALRTRGAGLVGARLRGAGAGDDGTVNKAVTRAAVSLSKLLCHCGISLFLFFLLVPP